jgi:hypothetical protein
VLLQKVHGGARGGDEAIVHTRAEPEQLQSLLGGAVQLGQVLLLPGRSGRRRGRSSASAAAGYNPSDSPLRQPELDPSNLPATATNPPV